MLGGGAGGEFAGQAQRDHVDREIAVATPDVVDRRYDGVGHQPRRVDAILAVGEAEARQVERVHRALLTVIIEKRPDLVGIGGGVDAVDQEQRRALARARRIGREPPERNEDFADLGIERRRQWHRAQRTQRPAAGETRGEAGRHKS